jgi:hypothetical protein
MKPMTAKDAFAKFNTVAHNVRNAWSAISPDGSTVAITWWMDKAYLDHDGRIKLVETARKMRNSITDTGARVRRRHMIHVRDDLDGIFRVVLARRADKTTVPCRTIERIPLSDVWMHLDDFNEETGEFVATQCGTGRA